MRVVAIIINYNAADESRRCAELLREQQGVNLEVVIVDNYSEHNNRERLIDYCRDTNTIFVATSKNRGFNAGCNAGLRYAESVEGDYALILTPDMVIRDKNYVATLVNEMHKSDGVVVAAGDIVTPSGVHMNPMPEDAGWMRPFEWIAGKDSAGCGMDSSKSRYCTKLSRRCFIIDMDFILAQDMFDESVFQFCVEDILSKQVEKAGKKMYYVSTANAVFNNVLNEEYSRECLADIRTSRIYYIRKYSGYNALRKAGVILSIAIENFVKLLRLKIKNASS